MMVQHNAEHIEHPQVEHERFASIQTEASVAVIIVNTNELHHLRDCLPSVTRQNYENYEVIVVDNGSTDGSLDYIASDFPQVRVVENGANLGYVGANNVGFRAADTEYVIVLNPDTEVDPDWLPELVKAIDGHPEVGIATSKILMFEQRDQINACGNDVSIIGIGFCRGVGKPAASFSEADSVASASGASFIIRSELLKKIGGFDETFWAYVEDTDLSWRVQLAGYDCVYVPTSIVYHKYKLKLSAKKFYFLDRNRYLLLFKHLRLPTLLAMLPIMAVSEVITWGYAFMRGRDYVKSKLDMYGWYRQNFGLMRRQRHAVQQLRQINDRRLLKRCTYELGFEQADGGFIGKTANVVFNTTLLVLYTVTLAVVRW